ncbi:MAG: hypothetical protein WA324_09585 [Bryobacteraceae bacterium]
MMPVKFLAALLLVVAGAAGQDVPAKPSRPGLNAELLSLGRTGGAVVSLTATVQLTNNSPDYVFVLLMGRPSAVDDAGGEFNETGTVGGVAYCPGTQNPPSKTVCIGKPLDERYPPLSPDNYTEIEPGKSAAFNISMRATHGSRGAHVFLTQEIAYRRVKESDLEKDAGLSDAQKLKSVRSGSLSFRWEQGLKEAVTSFIGAPRKARFQSGQLSEPVTTRSRGDNFAGGTLAGGFGGSSWSAINPASWSAATVVMLPGFVRVISTQGNAGAYSGLKFRLPAMRVAPVAD